MNDTREPQDYLPLTPAMFHVLIVLSEGEHHGYSILKNVQERAGASARLSTGTLYGIIKRLLSEGLIERVRTARVAGADARRRIYRLSPFGRRVAEAEAHRLQHVVGLARRSLLIPDTPMAAEEVD